MDKIQCSLLEEPKMNEIAKQVLKIAFDWLDAKYGTNPLAKYALDLAESLAYKAIDDGLINHLLKMQAFKAPEDLPQE